MSRRTLLLRLAGAAVGIVAIAFAAATIDDPIETGGDGGAGGDGEGGASPPAEQPVDDPVSAVEIPAFLEYLVLLAVVILAVVVAWYMINHRRRAVKMIAALLVFSLVVLAAVYALSAFDPSFGAAEPPEQPPPPENETGGDPGEGDGETRVDTTPIGSLLLALGAVAAVFVGALALSRRDTGSPDGEETLVDEDDEPTEEATAVGTAAGRAAERIETGSEDVDNEVYRAWREMTGPLEVERPETSTPREFADSAVEAGLEREDVDDLTRLFEDVRYGHRETTDVEERRAIEILRRIEAEYGEDADENGAGSAGDAGRGETP